MRPLSLTCLLLPLTQAIGQVTPDSASAAINHLIRTRADSGAFSGVVLVARNGVPLVRAAYGLADRDAGKPTTPETKFNLGSIDKLITRIAVWQLVAAGRLELDVPIGKYLADYPNAAVRDRVTARQLYDMSSGVGGFYNEAYERRHAEIRTVDDYLALFVNDPLEFEPGTSRVYSNGGYIILGKLIERLSGQSYYDYVLAHIAGPLGMKDTRHFGAADRVANRAIGYTVTRGPIAPNSASLAGRGSPAGGGYSTVDDFLKLDAALRSGKLIAGTFADSILPRGFRSGGADPLVYGGGGPGTNTQYAAFADGYTIIVFSNFDPPHATEVAQAIAKSLGKSLPGGTRVLRRPGE
jgi:D-alanyl-D-alanine carboxypeptidase